MYMQVCYYNNTFIIPQGTRYRPFEYRRPRNIQVRISEVADVLELSVILDSSTTPVLLLFALLYTTIILITLWYFGEPFVLLSLHCLSFLTFVGVAVVGISFYPTHTLRPKLLLLFLQALALLTANCLAALQHIELIKFLSALFSIPLPVLMSFTVVAFVILRLLFRTTRHLTSHTPRTS